tara:strand:+ start:230 stop:1024 length:795 start_codon:yes stop_codon:yes gene_type:complete
MNSLLILFGESFRSGGQHSRKRGFPESYEPQIQAAHSHMKFIKHLKETFNIDMVVSINSYTTQYDDSLVEIYDNVLLENHFHVNLIGANGLIHGCINRLNEIENLNETFDFILCMRIDLFLKDPFMELFNPRMKTILFPSVCYQPKHLIKGHPRINDTMIFVPQKYFEFITKVNICHHYAWKYLIECNLTYEDLDMMSDMYFDSDTQKDYNPFYYIVNRGIKRDNYRNLYGICKKGPKAPKFNKYDFWGYKKMSEAINSKDDEH